MDCNNEGQPMVSEENTVQAVPQQSAGVSGIGHLAAHVTEAVTLAAPASSQQGQLQQLLQHQDQLQQQAHTAEQERLQQQLQQEGKLPQSNDLQQQLQQHGQFSKQEDVEQPQLQPQAHLAQHEHLPQPQEQGHLLAQGHSQPSPAHVQGQTHVAVHLDGEDVAQQQALAAAQDAETGQQALLQLEAGPTFGTELVAANPLEDVQLQSPSIGLKQQRKLFGSLATLFAAAIYTEIKEGDSVLCTPRDGEHPQNGRYLFQKYIGKISQHLWRSSLLDAFPSLDGASTSRIRVKTVQVHIFHGIRFRNMGNPEECAQFRATASRINMKPGVRLEDLEQDLASFAAAWAEIYLARERRLPVQIAMRSYFAPLHRGNQLSAEEASGDMQLGMHEAAMAALLGTEKFKRPTKKQKTKGLPHLLSRENADARGQAQLLPNVKIQYSLATTDDPRAWARPEGMDRPAYRLGPKHEHPGKILVFRLTGLREGLVINGFHLSFAVSSSGGPVSLNAHLKSLSVNTNGTTSISIECSMAQVALNPANMQLVDMAGTAGVSGLTIRVREGMTYFIEISGITSLSSEARVHHVEVTLTDQ